jgi:leader peptidase (prepilin peptidase)/N-methyltransferase
MVFVEIITAVGFVLLFFSNNFIFDFLYIKYLIFFCFSICIIFIDYKHYIIPDRLTVPLVLIGIAFSFLTPVPGWKSSLLGATIGFVTFYLITKLYTMITSQIGLGGGDVKYLCAIGAFLGVAGVVFTIFFSSLLALLTFLIVIVAKRFQKRSFQHSANECRTDDNESTINRKSSVSETFRNSMKYNEQLKTLPYGPFLALVALAFVFFNDFILTLWSQRYI